MKIFVNSLSIFRMLATFAIIPTLLCQMYWTTFILFALAGFSDLFDGLLARKYNATSKLGGVLDHISDKFITTSGFILMAAFLSIWTIIVPVTLMICRELYISGLREFLGTQKIEMPVPKARMSLGKVKAALQMIAIGAFFLLVALGNLIARTPNAFAESLVFILPTLTLALLWASLAVSLWSAIQYTFQFAKKYKKIK